MATTTVSTSASQTTRLHISPLHPSLAAVVLPEIPAERISFHTLSTFPDRPFGFVDLLTDDANKLRKKLHGTTFKGSKMSVEEARPPKLPRPSREVEAEDRERRRKEAESQEKKARKDRKGEKKRRDVGDNVPERLDGSARKKRKIKVGNGDEKTKIIFDSDDEGTSVLACKASTKPIQPSPPAKPPLDLGPERQAESPPSVTSPADPPLPSSPSSEKTRSVPLPGTSVHPLEALYKIKTGETFTFFGGDTESDAEPEDEEAIPYYTEHDENEHSLNDEHENDSSVPPTRNFRQEVPAATIGSGGFQEWFWRNRGDLRRSWMRRRKMAAKEKRQRENRARARV